MAIVHEEIIQAIPDYCDPAEIVELCGLTTEELVDRLREEILWNIENFMEFMNWEGAS